MCFCVAFMQCIYIRNCKLRQSDRQPKNTIFFFTKNSHTAIYVMCDIGSEPPAFVLLFFSYTNLYTVTKLNLKFRSDDLRGEVIVPPAKKLEDLIHLTELCVDLLQQNEEHYAEVREFYSVYI